jgi:hypothetical protein
MATVCKSRIELLGEKGRRLFVDEHHGGRGLGEGEQRREGDEKRGKVCLTRPAIIDPRFCCGLFGSSLPPVKPGPVIAPDLRSHAPRSPLHSPMPGPAAALWPRALSCLYRASSLDQPPFRSHWTIYRRLHAIRTSRLRPSFSLIRKSINSSLHHVSPIPILVFVLYPCK